MNTQPVSSAAGDLFVWEASATIASNVAGANAAADRLQVASDSWFVLMAFLGSTNYDNAAGDFIAVIGAGPAAARTLVSPPFVPNNFEVMIRYNSDRDLMQTPMPQACLCSNGYRAGQQLPIPVLCPPMSTFDFDFYNVAPTLQLNGDGTAKSLQITFGLLGMFVPVEMVSVFLRSYAPYQAEAERIGRGWMRRFTNMETSGIPGS